MRFPDPLIEGTLIRRYKRFLADVRLADGRQITAHCPNSGSMLGCLVEGGRVLLSPQDRPSRKLKWTWEIAYVGAGGAVPALINTMWPNRVVREAIEAGAVESLRGYPGVRGEVRYEGGRSRFDLLLEAPGRRRCFVEVKNVTLVHDGGVARFPDAVTTRGARHLRELSRVVAEGDRAALVFHVPRADAREVRPADAIDPAYGEALREAAAAGVELLALRCRVTPEEVVAEAALPVVLDG